MKKINLIILMNLIFFGAAFAQKETDWELQHLMNTVSALRQSNETTWNQALQSFKRDSLWTMMDEIKSNNEYKPIGNNQFKLNAILNECSGYNKQMVRGDFLNGNDPNYDYSLTERGIKKGRTVSYEMSYREGKQTFIVMPYKKTEGKIEVKAFHNDKPIGETYTDTDGNIHLSINANVKLSDKLRLVITNHSDEDLPVVIINHNTTKH